MPGVLVNARHAANGAEVMIRREGPATAPTGYRVYVDREAVAWIAGPSASEAYAAQAAYLATGDELGAGGCLTDPEEQAGPITDAGGYLACGCHGSRREHACGPREWTPGDEQ